MNRANYTIAEACEILNVDGPALAEMLSEGVLEHADDGKRICGKSLEAAHNPSEQQWLHGGRPGQSDERDASFSGRTVLLSLLCLVVLALFWYAVGFKEGSRHSLTLTIPPPPSGFRYVSELREVTAADKPAGRPTEGGRVLYTNAEGQRIAQVWVLVEGGAE